MDDSMTWKELIGYLVGGTGLSAITVKQVLSILKKGKQSKDVSMSNKQCDEIEKVREEVSKMGISIANIKGDVDVIHEKSKNIEKDIDGFRNDIRKVFDRMDTFKDAVNEKFDDVRTDMSSKVDSMKDDIINIIRK